MAPDEPYRKPEVLESTRDGVFPDRSDHLRDTFQEDLTFILLAVPNEWREWRAHDAGSLVDVIAAELRRHDNG